MSIGDCPNYPACGYRSESQCDADICGKRPAVTSISKEQVVQSAREAGLSEFVGNDRVELGPQLQSLAKAAFKLGRNAGLEEAIRIAQSATHNAGDEYGHGYNKAAAEITRAIESLKDNTP